MAILRYRARRENQGPVKGLAAAPHLSGDRNRVIGFADIAALDEPEWAATPAALQFWPGRYTVEALVPAGQLAAVALDDGLTARLDAMAAVWCDAMFDDGDDTESEAGS